MSGREKPLILQNGMPIPQEYDKDLGDWTEYSNEHIKAIKAELALVKAELQAIKANQLSGDQKVQLSGNIVEVAAFSNIRTEPGQQEIFVVGDVSGYKDLMVYSPSSAHDRRIDILHRFTAPTNYGALREIRDNSVIDGEGRDLFSDWYSVKGTVCALRITNKMTSHLLYTQMILLGRR